jgi:hypothetical protein
LEKIKLSYTRIVISKAMKNRNDILKELQQIAPILSSFETKNIYSVPENYFLNFKKEVLEKIRRDEVQQELKSIAPDLADLKKVSSEKIPTHYFATFPREILNRISTQKADRPYMKGRLGLSRVIDILLGRFRGYKPKYAFAFAGTILLIVLGAIFSKVEQCNDLDCKMATLSDDEINNYLNDNSYAYSEEIFESSEEGTSAVEKATVNQAYNDLMKDISNEELDRALLN